MADHYEGLEEFLDARGSALLRTAHLLTGDRQQGEDLLQEALVRVASKWRRLRAKEAAEAYVRRTMYSLAVDGWRSRARMPRQVAEGPPDLPVPGDDASEITVRLTLDEALRRLTARQRQVLVLRFYDDLTEVQTAEVMRCSVGTVKSQTRHALQRLRELAPDLLASLDDSMVEEANA
jgi:RNA polymerase sigma-70 factor (sigma-E family)